MNEESLKAIEYASTEKECCYMSEKPLSIPDTPNFVIAFSFFMFLIFLHHILDTKGTYLNYFADKIKTTIADNLNLYFYNENSVEELEKENENKIVDEDPNIPKPYEYKYLDEVKKLANEIVFTELELKQELEQRATIRSNMENKLSSDKTYVETLLAYFEKRLEKLNAEKAYKKEEKKEKEEGEDDEDFEDEDFEDEETEEEKNERNEQAIASIQNDQRLYKKAQVLLETKTIDEEEINKLAREFILKERLDNLKNCIVMEKTPIGNAIMFYNNTKSSFEYYSDSTLPYRYLEVIARKYIITYKCKQIFVDMEQEIKEAEKKLEEKKKKAEDEKQKQEEEKISGNPSTKPEKPAKNVFAKFKNYNKDNSIKVAAVPLDRPSSAKQTKPQEEKVIKENANRFSFEGKLANFNFLKKIDRKVVDKRYAVSFAEFKKMQKTQ
uniref:Uncharacterized protein n=1 Tax=viral metagenome TaxID=1070528 RepID=A0A6C0K234_9ZZZZ